MYISIYTHTVYPSSVWGARELIQLASPATRRFNSSLSFLFLFLLCSCQKKPHILHFVSKEAQEVGVVAVRGSEVNSLSCEGLGGSNPLSGPLETLLRASYRELQPPAIKTSPPPPQSNPPQNIGHWLYTEGRGWCVCGGGG